MEPTSALSMYDLVLRVAREAGIAFHGSSGSERAMPPVDDEHNLDLCIRIVNDAIRMFIADAPQKGWRWMRRLMSVTVTALRITGTADAADATSLTDAVLETNYSSNDDLNDYWIYILTGTGAGSYAQITDYTASGGVVTVADWLDAYGNPGGTNPATDSTYAITPVETVEGDIHRYPLAENFGGEVNSRIEYASDTNHASIINWVDESFIRARRAVTVITGYPLYAAIRRLEFKAGGTGPKRRWEILFEPQPVATDTFEFMYTLSFDKLQFVGGLASSGSVTTLVDSSFANLYPDDYFNGWTCYAISGTGKNAQALVTDFTGVTFTVTVADWLSINGSTAAAVDPSSDTAYYLEPPGNLHPAGLKFDEVIKAACLAVAEEEIEDIMDGFVEKYVKKALVKAHQADVRTAPRTLGSMDHKTRRIRERTWLDITTANDL